MHDIASLDIHYKHHETMEQSRSWIANKTAPMRDEEGARRMAHVEE